MTDGIRPPKKLTRRSILKGTLTAAAAAAVPTILVRKASAQEQKVLKIVHWKHFVPDYDKYFDAFAKRFGEENKCNVEVDYVGLSDLPTAIAADISRSGGHDIFHLNGTGAWLYDQVLVDVSDVSSRLEKEFGGWMEEAKSLAVVRGKWLCVPHFYISFPWIINRKYFDEAGEQYTDKTSWQDVLRIGAKLKKNGHPLGIPYSQTPDSNDNLYPVMLSHRAYLFDKEGNLSFRQIGRASCRERVCVPV